MNLGSCDVLDDLSTKICFSSEAKDVNVEIFDMITKRNEVKTLVKRILYDCKCNLDSQKCNLNQ